MTKIKYRTSSITSVPFCYCTYAVCKILEIYWILL